MPLLSLVILVVLGVVGAAGGAWGVKRPCDHSRREMEHYPDRGREPISW